MGVAPVVCFPPGPGAIDAGESPNSRCDRSRHRQGTRQACSGIRQPCLSRDAHQGGSYWHGDRMKHIRIPIIGALVAISLVVGALAFVPNRASAASDCNIKRDLVEADLSRCVLTRADLSYADLTGADLTGANLKEPLR